ncbi:capsular polysaccharide export protein, LipB/KpsS family [Sphingomonas sp. CFBP 8764]|uniref:capsular polysaccharide export protein, LipB/KpsS family n=1 Tax=Sphingomonas sp. CFBP 8764 TaxID=2775275 RepID=UPI00177CD754|nr:hypothetical protein [Sphingomonas sp. CFBP 8764]MBD8552718.1 hypothetical protein [Sphingomonas sp. CFBP 8764]
MSDTHQQTFLIIVNSAAYSREYFTRLGAFLRQRGARVAYVLDSHLSDVMSGEDRPVENAWYFSDYCRDRRAELVTFPTGQIPTWDILFSDFDRFVTFGMTPPLEQGGCALRYDEAVLRLHAFFADVFDTVRPDAVLYEQVSNSFAMVAYREAERRGLPFFSLAPARIPGHIEISPTGALRDHVTVGALADQVRRTGGSTEARRIAEHYIASIDEQVPDYMRAGGDGAALMATSITAKYANRTVFSRLRRLLRYRRIHRDDMTRAYQFGDPLLASWALFRRAVKRRLRFSSVTSLFQQAVQSPAYFLYPLHFHPEASTSVLAPDFIDELSVIRAIAFRLPVNVKLVVKEHPSATALQPLSFYRALDALPNVELVAPGLNAKELARRSLGVICITSTLGFEAAVLNKPVICFGDVLFGYFPNVRMVDSYTTLDDTLAWAMNYLPVDPSEIVTAMTAYVEYADAGSFSFKGSLANESAIDHVAGLLMTKMAQRDTERATGPGTVTRWTDTGGTAPHDDGNGL